MKTSFQFALKRSVKTTVFLWHVDCSTLVKYHEIGGKMQLPAVFMVINQKEESDDRKRFYWMAGGVPSALPG
jgi:hypothetical protein